MVKRLVLLEVLAQRRKGAAKKALASLGVQPNVAPARHSSAAGPTYLPDAAPPAWRAPLEAAAPIVSFARVPVKERANVLHVELNRISKLAKAEPERLALLPNLGRVTMREHDAAMRVRVLTTLAELPRVQWLAFGQSSVLDEEVARLRELRMLDLHDHNNRTPIGRLPDALRELTNLEHLDLWGTRLTELPSWLDAFTKLRVLGLLDLPLTALPEGLVLPSLRVLQIRSEAVDLACVCERASAFPALACLTLQRRDGGQALPPAIGRLRELVSLKVGTGLTALPRELFELPKLRFLSLEFNDIDRLPDELASLPALETLDVQANPRLDVDAAVTTALRVPTLRGLCLPAPGLGKVGAKKLLDAGFLQAPSMSGDLWIRGGPIARWRSLEND